jgi:hypothetical protein
MAIHTFGEYLGFHPHLHALVADGLFQHGGWFHVLPESGIRQFEELFRARMLLGWKQSGFCLHRSKRVQPHQKEDLDRLAHSLGFIDGAVHASLGKRATETAKVLNGLLRSLRKT